MPPIFRAVADQHDAREWDVAGTLQHLAERIADARLRPGRWNRIERFERRSRLREAEQAHFERLFELCQRSLQLRRDVLESRALRIVAIPVRHAGGGIDRDREHVFPIAHPLDVEHRPPQYAGDQRDQRRLQHADRHQQAPAERAMARQRQCDDHTAGEDRCTQQP